MRFDSVGLVEEIVWIMRLADFPRGENRAILQRLYNGEPPETHEEAEQNQSQVNRNFLEGPSMLSKARSQWNNAFLKQKHFFDVSLDSGPIYKRQEWGHIISRNINRQLKRSRGYMEQMRQEGASVVLHGIAPSTFKDRRDPIPKSSAIASLMIPSETDLDFENLDHYAVFREWTPYQLYAMTYGPKVDPGWDMKVVADAWRYARNTLQKEPNSSAYQYMPERIEDLKKQDVGFWASDAVPTIDVWDFYFRESQDGNGWYRRVFLDWGVGSDAMGSYVKSGSRPESRNTQTDTKGRGGFIYSSGKRKFADSLSEILQCQFADCSAVPGRYHETRSLGWMLWGICDIANRVDCKFTENLFMQFLWWFRCASQGEMNRVKKAMFENMGVIPSGITMIPAQERFKPDTAFVELGFERIRQKIADNSASFSNSNPDLGNEDTATGTMAKVHSMNALMGGMMTLAYEYSKFKYIEQCRRFCIKNSPYKMVRDFRLACLKDGVPEEMLDHQRWDIEPDRALGDGNKILEMAIIQFLQGIRKNLSPDAQRKIDHMSIVSATDQPNLAEDLAPIEGQKKLSPSTDWAQFATERILRGLEVKPKPEVVPEDCITVWLGDMATMIQKIQKNGQVATQDQLDGLGNMVQHIQTFLGLMAAGEHEIQHKDEIKQKVRQYSDVLGKLTNYIKAFAQRLQEQQQKSNGGGRIDPKTQAQIMGKVAMDKLKLATAQQRDTQKLARQQAAFEMDQQREDRRHAADMRREDLKTAQELVHNRLRNLNEPDEPGGVG